MTYRPFLIGEKEIKARVVNPPAARRHRRQSADAPSPGSGTRRAGNGRKLRRWSGG